MRWWMPASHELPFQDQHSKQFDPAFQLAVLYIQWAERWKKQWIQSQIQNRSDDKQLVAVCVPQV